MAVLYYIEDCIRGTDHFNSKSKDVKISAADKLINIIDGQEDDELTSAERDALKEGRLGAFVAKNGGLDVILEDFPLPVVSTSDSLGMR